LLYGTDNLGTLGEEELNEYALNFMTSEGLDLIFRHVPESRLFIQTLALGRIIGHEDSENQ
jgi:hypothetical protein